VPSIAVNRHHKDKLSAAFMPALRRPPYIELYMMKGEGQGDEGNFIIREITEDSGISSVALTGCLGNSRDVETPAIKTQSR
jgi:hypothetical protein